MTGEKGAEILQVANYRYATHPSGHQNHAFWRAVRDRLGPLHVVGRGPVKRRTTDMREGIRYTVFPDRGGQLRFVLELGCWLSWLPTPSLYWVSDAAVSSLAVLPVARARKAPFLLELQGNFFSSTLDQGLKQHLARFIAMRAAPRSTFVRVCNTQHATELMGKGLPVQRIVVIPTRVDTTLFDPGRFEKLEARRQLGLPENLLLLVSVGNLIKGKGLAHAIGALPYLPREVMLVLAGDGPEQRSLRALASDLGMADRLILLGRLPYSEIPRLLAASDIFVFPSYSEGMPRAVNEAQAMRLPVVATAVDGIIEQVTPGETGFLVPPGDTGSLAMALEQLVSDQAMRERFGQAGRARVLRHFAFDTVMDQWEQLLRASIGGDHAFP